MFEVAVYCNLSDREVIRRPIGWLFDWFEKVQRARWRDLTMQAMAVEFGTLRALSSLSGKAPGPLPDYDDVMAIEPDETDNTPAWMTEFERANR